MNKKNTIAILATIFFMYSSLSYAQPQDPEDVDEAKEYLASLNVTYLQPLSQYAPGPGPEPSDGSDIDDILYW